MPLSLEDAITLARASGAGFSADALVREYGGSKRDAVPLAAQAKVAVAGERMQQRLDALAAAGVPADITAVFGGLAEAFGQATLALEDALLRQRQGDACALASAVKSAGARIEEAILVERSKADARLAAQEAELNAAWRRIADLETALRAVTAERDAALTRCGDATARLQLAQEREAALSTDLQDQRQARERAERRAADLAHERDRLAGELGARREAQHVTDERFRELQQALVARAIAPGAPPTAPTGHGGSSPGAIQATPSAPAARRPVGNRSAPSPQSVR